MRRPPSGRTRRVEGARRLRRCAETSARRPCVSGRERTFFHAERWGTAGAARERIGGRVGRGRRGPSPVAHGRKGQKARSREMARSGGYRLSPALWTALTLCLGTMGCTATFSFMEPPQAPDTPAAAGTAPVGSLTAGTTSDDGVRQVAHYSSDDPHASGVVTSAYQVQDKPAPDKPVPDKPPTVAKSLPPADASGEADRRAAAVVEAAPRLPLPNEKAKTTLPAYVIEPPDVLIIDGIRLIPRPPYRVEPLDVLLISRAQRPARPADRRAVHGHARRHGQPRLRLRRLPRRRHDAGAGRRRHQGRAAPQQPAGQRRPRPVPRHPAGPRRTHRRPGRHDLPGQLRLRQRHGPDAVPGQVRDRTPPGPLAAGPAHLRRRRRLQQQGLLRHHRRGRLRPAGLPPARSPATRPCWTPSA